MSTVEAQLKAGLPGFRFDVLDDGERVTEIKVQRRIEGGRYYLSDIDFEPPLMYSDDALPIIQPHAESVQHYIQRIRAFAMEEYGLVDEFKRLEELAAKKAVKNFVFLLTAQMDQMRTSVRTLDGFVAGPLPHDVEVLRQWAQQKAWS